MLTIKYTQASPISPPLSSFHFKAKNKAEKEVLTALGSKGILEQLMLGSKFLAKNRTTKSSFLVQVEGKQQSTCWGQSPPGHCKIMEKQLRPPKIHFGREYEGHKPHIL